MFKHYKSMSMDPWRIDYILPLNSSLKSLQNWFSNVMLVPENDFVSVLWFG